MGLQVGYAEGMITPGLERQVFLAGFGQNRRAETVHDDLYVRALALKSGPVTLVLCALDLIGFFRPDVYEVINRVREARPGVEVVIASTHTHHGPDTMGLWGPDDRTRGVDPFYMMALKDKIVATIQDSLEEFKPAALCATSVHVPGLARNTRNPEIVDDELTVAQFIDPQGTPLASLFNFPCHPEVLWEHNPHITSDYPGFLRREVEAVTHAPCIFFSGALGGMMTPDVQDHSFEEAEYMGRQLAEQGLQALKEAETDADAAIQLRKQEIKIRLTNILFKIAFRRALLPDVRDRSGRVSSEVNLIKIGSLWLATVPGELLPGLGLQIKDGLRTAGAGTAGVIGLANDELGYILPKQGFRYPLNPFKPGKHYEETMSMGKQTGPQVVAGVLGLL